ncbi:TlpA disulfide reductase family protein [Limnohabitans sp. INBF002]|uniref:TlpA family protein disulfide reductase n=1 Tax=Limnohabitans sp. INBF002 TaxID=2986280 RepID=UPI002491F6BF|nr:TlpA disulfide reductase family protein [Limnohabitans sp. INBF002]
MNSRTCVVQAKAQPVLGLFLGVCLAVLLSSFVSTNAWAQFDKTAWPVNVATPKIEAVDLQGKAWNAAELAGKVVVLNFWATWCAPCKDELPTLQTLHDISDAQTVVLTINVREPAARAARYMQSTGMTFPVISDPKGELAKRWGVTVYPTTLLIAPNGQTRWRIVGDVDWSGAQANAWLADVRQNTSPANATSKIATPKR